MRVSKRRARQIVHETVVTTVKQIMGDTYRPEQDDQNLDVAADLLTDAIVARLESVSTE